MISETDSVNMSLQLLYILLIKKTAFFRKMLFHVGVLFCCFSAFQRSDTERFPYLK